MLPRFFKGMSLYLDGENFIGRVEDVKLPDLNIKTDEYKAGGMDAPVDIEMGMEKLDLQFTLAEFTPSVIKQLGALTADRQLVLRAALQRQGEAPVGMSVRVQGALKMIGRDNLKQGEKAGMQCTVNCNSYIETQGSEELVNIDILNYKRAIGGVDQLAGMRALL